MVITTASSCCLRKGCRLPHQSRVFTALQRQLLCGFGVCECCLRLVESRKCPLLAATVTVQQGPFVGGVGQGMPSTANIRSKTGYGRQEKRRDQYLGVEQSCASQPGVQDEPVWAW